MATINHSSVASKIHGADAPIITWAMGDADTGQTLDLPQADLKCVQVSGSFGGATIVIEGSNDGITFFTLNDLQDSALSFAAVALAQIQEVPRFIRPVSSGGTATAVNVIINAVKRSN